MNVKKVTISVVTIIGLGLISMTSILGQNQMMGYWPFSAPSIADHQDLNPTAIEGDIVFSGDQFYGRTSTGWSQLSNMASSGAWATESAFVASNGSSSNESTSGWISCSGSAGIYDCTLTGFTGTPNCVVNAYRSANQNHCKINASSAISATYVGVRCNNSTSNASSDFMIQCHGPK